MVVTLTLIYNTYKLAEVHSLKNKALFKGFKWSKLFFCVKKMLHWCEVFNGKYWSCYISKQALC